jgi:hypothetical protein
MQWSSLARSNSGVEDPDSIVLEKHCVVVGGGGHRVERIAYHSGIITRRGRFRKLVRRFKARLRRWRDLEEFQCASQ